MRSEIKVQRLGCRKETNCLKYGVGKLAGFCQILKFLINLRLVACVLLPDSDDSNCVKVFKDPIDDAIIPEMVAAKIF